MSAEHYPQHEQLAELVARIRATPGPAVTVTVDDVRAAVAADASRSRRRFGLVFAAAAAAAVVALALPRDAGPGSTAPVEIATAAPTDTTDPAPRADDPARIGPTSTDNPAAASTAAALAPGVVVIAQRGPEPVVVSAWRVQVGAGAYRIETPVDVQSTLYVKRGDRVLEVEPASSLTLDGDTLTIDRGHARWQGASEPDTADATDTTDATDTSDAPDASTLSRRAEEAMASGDRSAAIAALTILARKHPRAPETRAGLVDLARLHAATGDDDRARCAYRLALDRWPSASIAPDIARALDRLGDGPDCRGLRPR